MSQSSFDSRKRSRRSSTKQSSTTGKTKNTSPYNGNFEQKLVDRGIYPDGYEGPDGDPLEPENLMTIREAFAKPRSSLSPSQFPESEFARFKKQNRLAKSESQAVTSIIPYIAGSKDSQFQTAGTIPFNNMKRFDPSITTPTPDFYYGASPSQIDARVRNDIGEYIMPSSRTSVPAAPNYFRADKSASGRADVAQMQAMYDGAVGARGMHTLQNYGTAAPVYDNNAYTISSTYHPGTGTLQMYATHPAPPASPGGETQYYTTQLNGCFMIGTPDGFRAGASAYRNAREWTTEQRDRFIASANAVAQRHSTETRSLGGGKDTNVSSDTEEESHNSETSADELALDYKSSTKRRRGRRVSS